MSQPSEATTQAAEPQLYSLKWTNHTRSVLHTLAEHLREELLVDVTLSCEGTFLKAHKVVLSSCSPYFMELFKVHQGTNPCIILNGFRLEILKYVLTFMYDGEVKVGEADLEELLMVAEALKIKGLGKVRRDTTATDSAAQESSTRTSTPVPQEPELVPESIEESPIQELPVKRPPSPIIREKSIFNPNKKRRKQSLSPMDIKVVRESSIEHTINGSVYTEENGKMTKSYELTVPSEVVDNKTVDRHGTKIPRPPNAFMIFANDWRKKLATEYYGESNKEISVRLGSLWKSLSTAKKDEYYMAAKKADDEHKARYPDYFYSPKEARIRKELRAEKPIKPTTTTIAILKKSEPPPMIMYRNNINFKMQDETRDVNFMPNENSNSSNDNLLIDD